jgi:NAD(P)-dependent dehydrogenase (short-subunit alcohol dehydrogenase family)
MTGTDNTIALVTGANKGIGFEVARGLGQLNVTVLVGSRDVSKGRKAAEQLRADGIDAHEIRLDVTDQVSIKAAAAAIQHTYGKLDILVNNAGVSLDRGSKPSEATVDYMRETYETNVFGVVAVTNAMLPLLHRSPAGRIVNQSSSMGSLTLATDPESPMGQINYLAYNSSKAALNEVTVEYAKELRDSNIKINASDPGYVDTDINQHQGFKTPAQGAVAALRLATLPADGPSGTFQGDQGVVAW